MLNFHVIHDLYIVTWYKFIKELINTTDFYNCQYFQVKHGIFHILGCFFLLNTTIFLIKKFVKKIT